MEGLRREKGLGLCGAEEKCNCRRLLYGEQEKVRWPKNSCGQLRRDRLRAGSSIEVSPDGRYLALVLSSRLSFPRPPRWQPGILHVSGLTMATPSILIVDSESCIVAMLELALSSFGFAPRCARSAGEAINASTTCAPDLALIDMDVDGWKDLVAALQTLNPRVRCCLVDAGVGGVLSTEEAAKLGIHHRFLKPFTLQQLRVVLER